MPRPPARMSSASRSELVARLQSMLLRSPQKTSILRLLLEGLREKEIAAQLGISQHTVHGHTKDMYRELAIHDRVALILVGREAIAGFGPE